jgi:hypothetical protein
MLLIVEGFQVPTIPFGEVVFKAGADVPLHKVKLVAKLGTMLAVMVTRIVSMISSPQILVAVNVTRIDPVAFDGIVKEVVKDPESLKLPLGAVHKTD